MGAANAARGSKFSSTTKQVASEDRKEQSLPLRFWQEIQAVLWQVTFGGKWMKLWKFRVRLLATYVAVMNLKANLEHPTPATDNDGVN